MYELQSLKPTKPVIKTLLIDMRRYPTTSNPDWLTALKEIVNKRPVVLFRFREEEWENLRSSKHGTNVFTFTHMRDYVNEIQAPSTLSI